MIQLNEMKQQLVNLTTRWDDLEKKSFSLNRFKNGKSMGFYTGFADGEIFDALYDFCDPGENGENIRCWHSSSTEQDTTVLSEYLESFSKPYRPRLLHPKEELFITLYSLRLNSELFSSYKNHTMLKALVGITPGGALSFVSQLFTGHIPDREIVLRSGFLDQKFENGDAVMADKGFTVQDLLPPGVGLSIPLFLGSQGQMSPEDVVKIQSIASLRVHVERAINKMKGQNYKNFTLPHPTPLQCTHCRLQGGSVSAFFIFKPKSSSRLQRGRVSVF